jgi:predicted dithiol-disulfide oxidoreductase (DUF899 family)
VESSLYAQPYAHWQHPGVAADLRQRPGTSAFAVEDGVVYQTYSAHAHGLDALWGMYPLLDRAPTGRDETGPWFRRRDEYDMR